MSRGSRPGAKLLHKASVGPKLGPENFTSGISLRGKIL